MVARNLAFDVERAYARTERIWLVDELPEQIVGDGAAALASRTHPDLSRSSNFRTQVVHQDHLAATGHDEALDHVLELANIARPCVLAEHGDGFRRDLADDVV